MRKPTDLRSIPAYRGPRRTLFVFDVSVDRWFICSWDGTEAVVPDEDLAGFVRHCAEQLPDPPEGPAGSGAR